MAAYDLPLVGGAVLICLVVLYGGGILALYWLQGRLIYPGERLTFASPLETDARFVWLSIRTSDGIGLACRYCPPPPGSPLAILLFHGNGEDLHQRVAIAERLANEGYGVLQAEYRGFGGNAGRPSERGLYADGRAALDFLESIGLPVVIHGYSLGSGVAVQLASEQRCAGLILEAPFTSLIDVAQSRLPWLPVRHLLRDRFDSASKIGWVSCPVLIYGGLKDKVVPPHQFNRLFELANEPKEILEISEAGHTGIWQEGGEQAVTSFLGKLALTMTR